MHLQHVDLITNDAEDTFMCLLAVWMFSLVMSVQIFCSFFIGLFVFLLLSSMNSLHIPESSPLSDLWVANVLSQFVACLFIFLTVSIDKQKCKLLTLFNNCFFLWCLVLSGPSLNHLCLFQGRKEVVLRFLWKLCSFTRHMRDGSG